MPRERARERLRECKRRLEQDLEVERATIVEHEALTRARDARVTGRSRWSGPRAVKPYPLPDRPVGGLNMSDPDARKLRSSFHA